MVIGKEPDIELRELKGHRKLIVQLVNNVQKLEKDGGEAAVLAGIIQVTPMVESMAKVDPFLLNQGPEALDGSVEGVQTKLGEAGDLAGEVPAVLQTQHHAAALDVHQVRHGSSNLEIKNLRIELSLLRKYLLK